MQQMESNLVDSDDKWIMDLWLMHHVLFYPDCLGLRPCCCCGGGCGRSSISSSSRPAAWVVLVCWLVVIIIVITSIINNDVQLLYTMKNVCALRQLSVMMLNRNMPLLPLDRRVWAVPVIQKKHKESVVQAPLRSILSCRLCEGFSVRSIGLVTGSKGHKFSTLSCLSASRITRKVIGLKFEDCYEIAED